MIPHLLRLLLFSMVSGKLLVGIHGDYLNAKIDPFSVDTFGAKLLGALPLSIDSPAFNAAGNKLIEQDSDAKRILDEHVKTLGGLEKLRSVTSSVTTGKMSLTGSEVQFDLKLWQSDGKYLLVLSSPQIEIRQGYDGSVVWEMNGDRPRILTGEERISAIHNNALILPPLTWVDDSFDGTIKLAGRQSVEGKNCFVVDFEPTNGSKVRRFVDPESYLVLRYQSEQKLNSEGGSPDRSLSVLVKDSDWREMTGEFSGIKFPYKQQFAVNNKLVYTITRDSIELNQEVDSKLFALPAEIQTLVKPR